MQSGLLTGTFDRTMLAPDDWRILHSEKFREPKLSRGLAMVEFLRPMAARYGKTVGQVALAWVLRQRAVTSAIAGSRHPGQVDLNCGGADWTIDDDDLRAIEEFSARALQQGRSS
jgi:aryl-alcohol dehydrogenase-like predicted oxidoreductase